MDALNYQLNEAKMFADVSDGMAIIVNSITGIYYGMNGLGTSVYENLMAGCSTAEILASLKAIPGAPSDVDKAFEEFISSLVGFEIIVPGEGASVGVASIDPAVAAGDGFVPSCTEYRDVQELLFADPIHEVDVDEGWKPE